ncbi:OmpA family protein [Bacteroidales bacterium AH-315-I05]|nr:OmpA family protein [Bacteroidales bacterium AH-315-I05]
MNHRKQLIKHLAICLFISLFTGTLSFAQLGRANHHYEHKEYARAIPFYEKAYKKNHTQEITIQLAECYRFTHDYTKAETLYEKALKQDSTNIELLQYYTEVLKKNKKLKQVKEVFVVYAIKNPNISAQDFMLSVDELMSWGAKKPQFKVENVEAVNTKFSDFSPVPYNGGIAFVSERNNNYVNDNVDYGWTQRPYLSVYYVDQNTDSTFTKPKLFSPAINDEYHNGPIAFDNQQNEAIFTRVSNLRKGKNYTNKPQLYISQKKGKKWQKAESFEHNDENHSFAHPSVSADGQWLYFVSDMPGGQGGKDLYVSKREGNSWSKPQNLGPTINTARDEIFPYIHKNGTLYFSSNGHTGYGGLDIFSAKKINAKWNDPENLREPLNSSTDDFGIVFIDSITGYISSNREGGKGADDIYTFKMLPKEKSTSIKGLFMYSELNPAKNAKVRLLDANNVEIAITNTDDEGNFEFKNLKPNEDYIVVIDQDDVKLIDESRVYLVNEQGEKVIQLSQKSKGFFIFHALPAEVYNKLPTLLAQDEKLSILTIYGQVFEKLPGDIPPDMQLYVLNDQGQIIYTTTIDEKGNFVLKNLPPDNNYTFKLKDPNIEAKVMILNQNREPLGTIEKTEEGFIYHRYDFMKPKNAVDLFGRAYDKLPGDLTPGMEVYLVNDKGEIIYTAVIDEKGNFEFKNLPPDHNYIFKMKEEDVGFKLMVMDEEDGTLEEIKKDESGNFIYETLVADKSSRVTMQQAKDETDDRLLTVGFFGQVYQKLPGDVPEGMKVYLVNDEGEIMYEAVVDEKGNFEFKNLPPDHNYIFKIEAEDSDIKLIAFDKQGKKIEEIKANTKGEFVYERIASDEASLTIANETNEEIVVKKGDSYVLSNIYYDVAKWEVNPRSSKELDKLAAMMKKNPHVAVALSSHTDCRGQNTFNMALSQVRAEYAVNYIVSKGIAKNRIMGKGYGETVPVSPCNNCEQCSHNKHYENRRTEIKIVKKHW